MTKRQLGVLIAAIISSGIHQGEAQTGPNDTEKRCGWFQNPTPANYWLTDADGEWIVSVQGIYQSEGFYELPPGSLDFDDQWVSFSASGSYGYGCACMDGSFDQCTNYAAKIIACVRTSISTSGERDRKVVSHSPYSANGLTA